MIYGPPKSGKSVMAATANPPFRWLAADGSTCLKSVVWAYQAGRTKIKDPAKDLIAYTPREDLNLGLYPTVAMAFNRMTDMIDHWFSPADVDNWKTLVLDSFTEINEWAIDLGLGLNAQLPKPDRPLSGSHKINMQAKLRIVTGEQDYKSAQALCQGFLNDIRAKCAQHNKDLFVLCHEWTESREAEDGTVNVIRYAPLLIGQLRQRVPKSFDDLWYMQVHNNDFKVRLHADARHLAGTRWGQIVAAEEEADFQKLIEKVRKFHNC